MSDLTPDELEAGRWIKARLTSAGVIPTLASDAFLDIVPGEADLPAVRYGVQSRNDVRTNGQHIAVSKWNFLVLGCVESHKLDDLQALAKAIHAALHKASGQTTALQVLACTRMSTFGFTSHENGRLYRLQGGVYEIVGQAI